jgi:hypothetical protein
MNHGKYYLECFAARLLENRDKVNQDVEALAYITECAFETGTGTSSRTVLFFLLAIILNLDVLRAAQMEIHKVLEANNEFGPFDLMADLPYCNVLCKEVLRYDFKHWRPFLGAWNSFIS